MEIINKYFKLPSYVPMMLLFLALSVIFTICYWKSDDESKLSSLYVGAAASFFVAAVQFFCQIYEQIKLRKYENMGIIDMLKERSDKNYYGNLIKNSKREILIMGVTASRFFDDFANRSVPGNSQLIEAIGRGVIVKILLPKEKYLDEKDRAILKETTIKLSQDTQLSQKCTIKYFDHTAAHSLMLIDEECIVGPIFKGLSSKNTPALVLKKDSVVATPYINNFNREWESSDETHE